MSERIISRIRPAFNKALDSGSLFFFPSTVYKHEDSGIHFELRLCPALLQKPTLPTPQFERKADHDPFAPPYIPDLFVGELEGDDDASYVVLLNKYSVVPRHFLLVTKDFQPQSSPLLPSDLLVRVWSQEAAAAGSIDDYRQHTFQLLVAAKQAGEAYFAFYNCGTFSGASQPHKHIQFIPIGDGCPPTEELAKSQDLETSKPYNLSRIPYAHFVCRLPSSLSSSSREVVTDSLCQAFLQLIDLAVGAMRRNPGQPQGSPSFNVLLTLDHLHVIPRSKEVYALKDGKGPLSVNALGYAGMLLVKNDEEMEAVKETGIINILRGVGVQREEEGTEVD